MNNCFLFCFHNLLTVLTNLIFCLGAKSSIYIFHHFSNSIKHQYSSGFTCTTFYKHAVGHFKPTMRTTLCTKNLHWLFCRLHLSIICVTESYPYDWAFNAQANIYAPAVRSRDTEQCSSELNDCQHIDGFAHIILSKLMKSQEAWGSGTVDVNKFLMCISYMENQTYCKVFLTK